jgi:dephospho-CoA kinase
MKSLRIGITGGIGSGKSLVCRIFHCLSVPVYDADSRAKYLMTTNKILIEEIQKEFGKLSYNSDGVLDRTYLAQKVFNNPVELKKLNQLVHPRVADDYIQWADSHSDVAYTIKEAALLFESGSAANLNKTITVYAPAALRIQRVLKRDAHRTEQNIKDVIQSQMEEEEKRKRADFVILNDESVLLIPQVLHLHKEFS